MLQGALQALCRQRWGWAFASGNGEQSQGAARVSTTPSESDKRAQRWPNMWRMRAIGVVHELATTRIGAALGCELKQKV